MRHDFNIKSSSRPVKLKKGVQIRTHLQDGPDAPGTLDAISTGKAVGILTRTVSPFRATVTSAKAYSILLAGGAGASPGGLKKTLDKGMRLCESDAHPKV